AHPRREIGGMLCQSRAEDLFGLRELFDLPQLFGQRKEKAALRIGFQPKPQFLDLWATRWLRHGIKTLLQKRTAPEGAVYIRSNSLNRQRVEPTSRNVLVPAF